MADFTWGVSEARNPSHQTGSSFRSSLFHFPSLSYPLIFIHGIYATMSVGGCTNPCWWCVITIWQSPKAISSGSPTWESVYSLCIILQLWTSLWILNLAIGYFLVHTFMHCFLFIEPDFLSSICEIHVLFLLVTLLGTLFSLAAMHFLLPLGWHYLECSWEHNWIVLRSRPFYRHPI